MSYHNLPAQKVLNDFAYRSIKHFPLKFPHDSWNLQALRHITSRKLKVFKSFPQQWTCFSENLYNIISTRSSDTQRRERKFIVFNESTSNSLLLFHPHTEPCRSSSAHTKLCFIEEIWDSFDEFQFGFHRIQLSRYFILNILCASWCRFVLQQRQWHYWFSHHCDIADKMLETK